jgi:hypothetical protein
MYSVMAIFNSSIMWGFFEYTELGAQRLFDHSIHIVTGTLEDFFMLAQQSAGKLCTP